MLKRMRRIGIFFLAIAVVISCSIIASANERDGTDNSVDTQSTTSNYVIENKSSNKKDIVVTIEHYNGNTKIYSDDVRTLSYGAKINDYAKASNWDVESVRVNDNDPIDSATAKHIELTASGTATVRVNYTAPSDVYVNGATTFYDYVVKPYTKGNTWQDDVVYPSQSINYAGNYPEGSKELNRIGVGNIDSLNKWTQAQNPQPITSADKTDTGEEVNQSYYTEKSYTTAWNTQDTQRINTYNHGNAVKGLIAGLSSDYKTVDFNYDEPGLFSNEEKAGKNIINDYKLRFKKTGDTYELTNVLNNSDVSVADNMASFFPLDNTDFHKNHPDKGNDRENTHNYYFGMRYDVTFKIGDYIGDLNYEFTGDDDLWVLLDGKVIIDLGGIHDPLESGVVNIWDKLGYSVRDGKLYDGNGLVSESEKNVEHRITVLYMERGGNQSNCHMKFTLPSAKISEVTNVPLANLSIQKIDKDDKTSLVNARFSLINSNGEKETLASDENGNLTFANLKVGEYTLTEDVSPDGYASAESYWKVKVSADANNNAVVKLYLVQDGKEEEVTPGDDGKYIIENKKQPTPPPTPTDIDDKINYSKTSTVSDWDKRTYDINISASSKLTESLTQETQGLADMMLVLDMSGSMGFGTSSTSNQAVGCSYLNNKKNNSKFLNVKSKMDTTKVYYIDNDSTKPVVYLNETWKKYENDQWKNVANNDAISICNSRITALKESVNALLYEISSKSSNSKIGITTFSCYSFDNHKKTNSSSLQAIGNDPSELIKFFNKFEAEGGTEPGDGLKIAYDQLLAAKNSGDTLPKYVVLFTDGKPTGYGNQWNSDAQTSAERWANKIKTELGVKIYTIGFALDNQTRTFLSGGTYNRTNYPGIATDASYAYNAENAGQLGDIFQTISSTITSNISISNANITDVIDPRFQIIYKNDKNEDVVISNDDLKDGKTIEISTSNGKNGIVYLYEDPENNLVTQAIKWEGQTLPNEKNDGEKSWNTTFTVKAREEYIGGNNVPTNVSPDSKITTGFGDATLPQPKVNVKVDLAISNDDIWIDSGSTVPVDSSITGKEKVYDVTHVCNSKGNIVKKYDESTKTFKDIESSDLTIQWFNDADCKTPTTKEKIAKVQPDGRTDFYLKVGYNGGVATDESNANTNGYKVGVFGNNENNISYAINDGKNGEDEDCITDFKTCKNNKSEYGIYRIHVKYTLPETGGRGVYWYTAGGMLLMIVAAIVVYVKRYNEYMNK